MTGYNIALLKSFGNELHIKRYSYQALVPSDRMTQAIFGARSSHKAESVGSIAHFCNFARPLNVQPPSSLSMYSLRHFAPVTEP